MALDLLAFAAHRDDIEITCGGILIRGAEKGYKVGACDLSRGETGVVQAPQLRALGAGIPLAELVADREDALFGPRFFFVPARAANAGVDAEFGDGVEQCHRLKRVAALGVTFHRDPPAVDRILDAPHDELFADAGGYVVAKLDDLGKIMAGVDMNDRKWKFRGTQRLHREMKHHDRVLAS